jgi:hypothetical protein
MDVQFSENKLISLYIEIDDLLKAYKVFLTKRGLPEDQRPTRIPALSAAEICTILVAYHHSGYKCFEYYYRRVVLSTHQDYFPDAPTYERFLDYLPRVTHLLYLWLFYTTCRAQRTGLYFIDSKKLEVCHIKREYSHRVFQGLAAKGKTSTGYFFGLNRVGGRLHMVINNLGEIICFLITPGNVADNNHKALQYLLKGLQGVCVGDKGYLTTLFEWFYEQELEIVKRPRKNMRTLPIANYKHQLINLRPVIESAFDIMGTICDIDHTRHRSPVNAVTHLLAGLVAYQHLPQKPCVFFPSMTSDKAIHRSLLAA